jgi:hypothetical protein
LENLLKRKQKASGLSDKVEQRVELIKQSINRLEVMDGEPLSHQMMTIDNSKAFF